MMNFYITHNGCEPTLFETEKARANLIRLGFNHTSINNSDVIIVLGCTFTNQKDEESKKLIEKYLKYNKNIIISGCFIENEFNYQSGKVKYIKTNQLIPYLTKVFESEVRDIIDIPIVPISTGCTGNCSYCSIKFVKGQHLSKNQKVIFEQIEHLSGSFSTIKLVGQDIAAYGTDTGTSLIKLLKDIICKFPSINLTLGSLNPNHLLRLKDNDLEILGHSQISGNIHVPVQSSSNKVLKHMKRDYSIEEYVKLINRLNQIGVTNISTDIISGYPIESVNDHEKNLEFLSEFYFNFIEIFMFEPRNKTLASKMQDLEIEVKSRRTIELIVQYLNKYSVRNNLDIESLIKEKQVYNTNIDFN